MGNLSSRLNASNLGLQLVESARGLDEPVGQASK